MTHSEKYVPEEYNPMNKLDRRSFRKKFDDFLYNEETGEIMGRTPESWCKKVVFYVSFYGVLACLFAACMAAFLQHFINPRIPYRQLDDGLIGTSPGLGFRPRPRDVRSTLISYAGTRPEDYAPWEEDLIEFLSVYKKKGQIAGAGQNIFACNDTAPPPGRVCDVDVDKLAPCIEENHFSFHKSSPCVFLKLNRVFGWRPEPYERADELPARAPRGLRAAVLKAERSRGRSVWVWCDGATAADRESLGNVTLLPGPALAEHYFPYTNAEGYLSPLVALHLERPRRGILIAIRCQAWARNLDPRRSAVDFEIMID